MAIKKTPQRLVLPRGNISISMLESYGGQTGWGWVDLVRNFDHGNVKGPLFNMNEIVRPLLSLSTYFLELQFHFSPRTPMSPQYKVCRQIISRDCKRAWCSPLSPCVTCAFTFYG